MLSGELVDQVGRPEEAGDEQDHREQQDLLEDVEFTTLKPDFLEPLEGAVDPVYLEGEEDPEGSVEVAHL